MAGDTRPPRLQVGIKMQGMIAAELESNSNLQTVLKPFYASTNGRTIVEEFQSANEKAFPSSFDEMRGIAAGAKVPFEQILLMNLQQELSYFTPPSNQSYFWEQCSDSLLLTHDQAIIGHNEDSGNTAEHYTSAFVSLLVGLQVVWTEIIPSFCMQR